MLGACSIGNEHTIACYPDNAIPFPRKNKKKFTVCVEGNIGSGKSTFLEHFKKSKSVELHMEPVELWKSVRGHNTLDLMYKDTERWSLTFQSYVQLTMLQIHTKRQIAPVKMMERSLFSAKYCFVENLYKGGLMPPVDYSVLTEWFDWIRKNEKINIDLIVYLRASPETCLQRIKQRARREEAQVPIGYLETLHDLHEDWLIHQNKFQTPCPVLVLDADKQLIDLQSEFEHRRTEILCGYC